MAEYWHLSGHLGIISNSSEYIPQFHDVRGPYPTIEVCKKRALEMSRDIGEMTHGLMPKKWKCKPLGKGMLS